MGETFSEDEVYCELLNTIEDAGSQKALAEQLGISRAYLSDCARRNRPARGKLLQHIGFEYRPAYVALCSRRPNPPAGRRVVSDLIERLRAHAEGRHGLRMQSTGAEKIVALLTEKNDLLREAADRIAALEAEASEGERRGLERAAEVADELASQWVIDASNAKTAEARAYFENRHSAASWVCDRIHALIPAPAREEQ